MNTFDFAMKMELDGKAYYEKLAAETSVIGLKTIFTKLAADELKHYNTIKSLKKGVAPAMADTMVLEETKNLFKDLMGDKTVVGRLMTSLDGYQQAKQIEADSVRYYEALAKTEDNSETVQLLLRIANEEKKHFNILDNLYDFVLKPEYFLAWGEFSNLEGL